MGNGLTSQQDCPHISSKKFQRGKHKSERQMIKKQIEEVKSGAQDNTRTSYGRYAGWVW